MFSTYFRELFPTNAKQAGIRFSLSLYLLLLLLLSRLLVLGSELLWPLVGLLLAFLLLLNRIAEKDGLLTGSQESRRTGEHRIVLGIASYILVIILSSYINGGSLFAGGRIPLWCLFLTTYWVFRRWPNRLVEESVQLAFWPYALWVLFVLFNPTPKGIAAVWYPFIDNPNIMAFQLIGLLYLLSSTLSIFTQPALMIVIVALSWHSGAVGGVAAIGLSEIFFRMRSTKSRVLFATLLCAGLLLYSIVYQPRAQFTRISIWTEAFRLIIASPWIGMGPGTFLAIKDFAASHIHCHNIVIQILFEAGILGFICFCVFARGVYSRVALLTLNSRKLLMIYAIWGLVDDPLFWMGSSGLAALALTCSRESDSEEIAE